MKKCMVTLIIFSCVACANAFAADVPSSTTTTDSSSNVTNNSYNGNAPTQTITHSTTTTTVNHPDEDIVNAVYAKYTHDPALIGTALTVTSKDGVVTISGTVTAQSQADEAMIAAKKINGVKDVNSLIHVTTNQQTNNPEKAPNY